MTLMWWLQPGKCQESRSGAHDSFPAEGCGRPASPEEVRIIISNPPYGERLEEKSALPALYSQIGEAYKRLDAWSMYLITSYEDTERYIGRKADKTGNLHGMIKTYFISLWGLSLREGKRISRVYEIFKEIYCIYIHLGTYLCV